MFARVIALLLVALEAPVPLTAATAVADSAASAPTRDETLVSTQPDPGLQAPARRLPAFDRISRIGRFERPRATTPVVVTVVFILPAPEELRWPSPTPDAAPRVRVLSTAPPPVRGPPVTSA